MAMRTQGAEVNVSFVRKDTGERVEFVQTVQARCTDHATHEVEHEVRHDYPGAMDLVVKFKQWLPLMPVATTK